MFSHKMFNNSYHSVTEEIAAKVAQEAGEADLKRGLWRANRMPSLTSQLTINLVKLLATLMPFNLLTLVVEALAVFTSSELFTAQELAEVDA